MKYTNSVLGTAEMKLFIFRGVRIFVWWMFLPDYAKMLKIRKYAQQDQPQNQLQK